MEESTRNPSPTISTIYGLYDECHTIRYVGVTYQPLTDRLRMHMNDAKRGKRTHCAAWIRSMSCAPVIGAIEVTFDRSREVFWIAYHRSNGERLTNLTDGGEGVPGLTFSDEHRTNISDALRRKYQEGFVSPCKGREVTAETREKLRRSSTGKTQSDESRLKIGKSSKGRIPSAETRAKMSLACKGAVASPETRAKISAANKGKVISEETRTKLRKPKTEEARKHYREAWITRRGKGYANGWTGRVHSEATRQRLRDLALIREAKKRGDTT